MIPLACLIAAFAQPPADPALLAAATDGLSRAADALDRGDPAAAVGHLAGHVKSHPDQVMVRAYLAELLFKQKRFAEAAAEFETFITSAEEMTGPPKKHLVHCHTRLMGMAEAAGDEYRERLHRGVGLVLLVQQWERDAPQAAGTLTTATAELRDAARLRPTDPRPHLYLADAYRLAGQPGPAKAAARRAGELPPTGLSPAEKLRVK